MKEIALIGTTGHVHADVMGALLAAGMAVNTMVDYPEKVMLEDTRLVIKHFPYYDTESAEKALTGYETVVLTYSDDLQDAYTNDLTLKTFAGTAAAARKAGAKRLIVVGSPDSEAFFVSDLRRLDDIDWVFISTEGDYAHRVADEVATPTRHKQIYAEA